MKQTLITSILIIGLGSFCLTTSASSDGLDWMLGCWTSEDGSSREVWVRHSDKRLIGFSATIHDNQFVFHETLSIDVKDDNILYQAHPKGQATTTFTATGFEGTDISFLNPGHDYPQKVRYVREGNHLNATISLLDDSNPTSFPKMKCE